MANVPPNDPNVDAPAIVPAPVNPDHAPAQPVGLRDSFTPHWIGNNNLNNQNGWIEKDVEEEEEDPEEDPKEDPEEEPKDDDDDTKIDDEAEVFNPYMDNGSNNPPPPNSEDEETPPTSLVIPDADGQPILPIASFGQNFHFWTAWKRLGKMEKFMSERIDTEGIIKKKFKEQDRHFHGLGCDNIKMDRTVRNVMSDFSGLKKLVKGLSGRFDEYERSKVFDAKKVLEKELVNERNGKEFYREFSKYMCRMFQNRQKSKGSFPLPLGSQVRELPAEPSARPIHAPYPDDPYVVTRDTVIADAAIGTFDIDDDDDDTAPMDSQPHEPRFIIMANVPPNDPNVDAPAIVPTPVNPDHAPAQPVGLRDGFTPHWIGNNNPNNQNGWIEEDVEEEEEDPEEDPKEDPEEEPKDDDDDTKIDDEAEVFDPYMDNGSNNPPPPNSKDEETPPTSPVIPDADGQPILPIASFGTAWKRLGKMEKFMSERIDTEGRIKKKELPAEPSARPVHAPYPDDPYVVTRDTVIADAAIGTFDIDDDDDDTAPMDSHPHEPRGSPRDTQIIVLYEYSSHLLESVEAAIRAERERVQNEANHAEGPNVASFAKECTFVDFMMCSRITFSGNEGAVATLGIEVVTRKTWAEIKVLMTEKFCLPEEIQRIKGELWNLRVKAMDISSYTTYFNELVILCPGMVPTERKKVEAYIRRLSENIKREVTLSEPASLSKAVRMAHTLMEQKVKAIAEREADNKKRKWENYQGVVEKEPIERRMEDVPVICKFPDGFSEDLPGLPPPRQV
nr:hypothetical protein [Tanacetum cinerariifolium]